VHVPLSPPLLVGPGVRLRQVELRDRAHRLALGRDPEFHRLVGGDPARADLPLTDADAQRWYAEIAADPLSWVLEVDARMIGSARLHALDRANRRAAYAIGIFSPSDRGRGYGREATDLVLAYAFGTLQLHRVEVRVLDFNTRAIQMYERCGFSHEGVEREAALIGGRWENDVRLSILEHEFGASGRG
jgi:[ribosomal protein S5]-alanine N-acetyltransferase